MRSFGHMKVGLKLALLAGVPVLGALLLSLLIARDARVRSQAAAALGSIEDLAQLTDEMTNVVHELQRERAQLAFSAGIGKPTSDDVAVEEVRTDEVLNTLSAFLAKRDESKLPPTLRGNLAAARTDLARLGEIRTKLAKGDLRLSELLAFYGTVNDRMISATAALTELSEEGEILRNIARLVAVMQVIERGSREHALLSYVFGKGEFPPGAFRQFVTLTTEKEIYIASLKTSVTEAELRRLEGVIRGPDAEKMAAMRKIALETTDEQLSVDAAAWFNTGRETLSGLRLFEKETKIALRAAAARKVEEARVATQLGIGLAIGVVSVSSLLGWIIARGMTRSVLVLSRAAKAVRKRGDFSIRAEKTSTDEIGMLTDAFNEMLSGIQNRDGELQKHRENLEATVAERTRELSARNEQMRLVLDNVEQGLVMIDRNGVLQPECSRAFAESFGIPRPGQPLGDALAKNDEGMRLGLELAYEQLTSDVIPVEMALDQMPKMLVHGDRHYALNFQTVMRDGRVDLSLLVVRDVTAELAARHADAVQQEKIKTFERVMRDRLGFTEFLADARLLVEKIRENTFPSDAERMRAIHTLKGNSALYDVRSVSEAAHRLEQSFADDDGESPRDATTRLVTAWDEFARQVVPYIGHDVADRIEMTNQDLEGVLSIVRARRDYADIERALVRLRHEPARLRFARIEEQLKNLAKRLDKPEPTVVVDAGDVRIPIAPFREFWATFAHVVRNVVDHGLQSEAERAAQGKSRQNCVVLRAVSTPQAFAIEISDDGRGIDWNKLAAKAAELRLPHETRADLVQIMLTDGVSTAAEVTENSGRGVGMSAVLQACSRANGEISIDSEPGQGTRLAVVFPPVERDRTAGPSLPVVEGSPGGARVLGSVQPAPRVGIS